MFGLLAGHPVGGSLCGTLVSSPDGGCFVFENLIESKAKGTRTIGQTVMSVLVHGLVIFGAVKATQGVAETIKNRPVDTTMVFLKPPPPPPPPPDQPPPDVIVSANPPPKGFQTVVAPTDIPKDIPPIDLNEKPFDPKDFTGKGVEGGIATGVVGGTGPGAGIRSAPASSALSRRYRQPLHGMRRRLRNRPGVCGVPWTTPRAFRTPASTPGRSRREMKPGSPRRRPGDGSASCRPPCTNPCRTTSPSPPRPRVSR